MVYRPPLPIPSTPHFDDDGKPSIQKSQWLAAIDNMFGSFNSTPSGDILGNITNASALAVPVTLTAVLDAVMGSVRGSILVRGASTWTVLTLGSTSNVLTSNGTDLVYAGVPSSGRVLLNTLTANTSTALSDTTSLTGTYPDYELVFENILPSTSATELLFRVNSGTAVQSSGYLSAGLVMSSASSNSPLTGAGAVPLSDASINNAGGGLSGSLRISNPATSNLHGIWAQTIFENSTTTSKSCMVGGYWNSSATINGFQVLMSSGSITSGKVYVYGLL